MTVVLELSAAEAWPSLSHQVRRGWLCRTAEGYTQRANSCLPLETPETDLEARIEAVEAYYAGQGQPPVFKLPEEPAWASLDAVLEARHYAETTPSRVLSKTVEARSAGLEFRASESFDDSWWQGYLAASALPATQVPTARRLSGLVARPVVARLTDQGNDAAWGFASLVEDRAWVFDVVVDPTRRHQGLGRALMTGIEAEVFRRGVRTLHLQVLAANSAANALYTGLGFQETYRYHYRRKKEGT